jgi:protein ImuB
MLSSGRSRKAQLWVAVRLPALPFNALGLLAEHVCASSRAVAEQQRVMCINSLASDEGVSYGMDVTTAQLISGCELQLRDRKLEQELLAKLSADLYVFTPYIEIYQCENPYYVGLLLEVSTCLNLFGGIQILCAKMSAHLHLCGVQHHLGLAHSAMGAWLLSFPTHLITGTETTALFIERLKLLPIQLLHDHLRVVEALEKTGFNTLADIALQIEGKSISSFKKRFGQKFADAICAIFGIEQNFQQNSLFDTPPKVYQPIEFFSDRLQLEYPVAQTYLLQFAIESLLQKLADFNRKRQLQCQQINWRLLDIYGNSKELIVNCDNPQSHWQLFYDLTLIQLECEQLTFEVDTLELICRHLMPLQQHSQALAFDDKRTNTDRFKSFALTAAKLKARLGDAAVFKISYCDSFLPEVSNQAIALNQRCNQQLPKPHAHALRPCWLYAAPIAIEERPHGLYYQGYLKLLIGPERIQGNWWDNMCARDYYLAQRQDNVRFWIYLDLHKKSWFAQGIFR